jgi:hypothetical protein
MSLCCKMFGMKLCIILKCAEQQMEHILNLHKAQKNAELLFTVMCI